MRTVSNLWYMFSKHALVTWNMSLALIFIYCCFIDDRNPIALKLMTLNVSEIIFSYILLNSLHTKRVLNKRCRSQKGIILCHIPIFVYWAIFEKSDPATVNPSITSPNSFEDETCEQMDKETGKISHIMDLFMQFLN